MNKFINIAIVGLGQIGNYLYNELNIKKKEIEVKTGKKIKIVAISAKNKDKKRKFKINKKIFYSNPLTIFKSKKIVSQNLEIFSPNMSKYEKNKIKREMWKNYGMTFIEYMFLNYFKIY